MCNVRRLLVLVSIVLLFAMLVTPLDIFDEMVHVSPVSSSVPLKQQQDSYISPLQNRLEIALNASTATLTSRSDSDFSVRQPMRLFHALAVLLLLSLLACPALHPLLERTVLLPQVKLFRCMLDGSIGGHAPPYARS